MDGSSGTDWDLSYGELCTDKDFVLRSETLKANLVDLQNVLDKLLPLKVHYNKMPLQSQIEYDLFLAFTLNSLYWIRLRLKGIDPSSHPIRHELLRIQTAMTKWQELKDREKRPTVNIDAAKRFIKSGLYDRYRAIGEPANKKRRFNEDDE